ncbi:sulfur carrier protein ThiS [Corynebacterium anserum]|uniref:Sulfur carrier protein ThiS n=1 Tax=Corynebacterium anserum TaxID=2684406 RepID=A0A7G7YQG3_9CORY|nr:sulfur carrier protein ThiS [Corynebacterium anserum]MBC2682419.1 sulfur carrier protein ThiS [Corynebacterium anserum]QNH96733.1 sulfur carrier protein ThiS [Corynebacterium anserum]
MQLIVNGEPFILNEGSSVEDLVGQLTGNASEAGMAVAIEGRVVSRSEWTATALKDGMSVDVLTAVQGG